MNHVLGSFEDICESDLQVIIQKELKAVMGAVFPQAFGEHPGESRNLCILVLRELINSLMEGKSYVKRSLDMQNNFGLSVFFLTGEETDTGK